MHELVLAAGLQSGNRRASAWGTGTINALLLLLPAPSHRPPPRRPRRRDGRSPSRLLSSRRERARGVLRAGALLALASAAITGCGSSQSSGTTADPAGVVPAGAPIYAGAEVRPQGSEKTNAQAVGQALTHQADPYTRLLLLLQTPGSPTLSFATDVAPWLGPHAGVFLTSESAAGSLLPALEQGLLGSSTSGAAFPFGSAGAQGAIVLDTSDSSKAHSFLDTQASRAGAQPTSYKGVSYMHTSSGIAFALVDRFAVIGSDTGVRDVIETAQGAAALLHASGYSALTASAPAGALAHLYTNPTAGQRAALPSEGHPEGRTEAGDPLALLAGGREANISLVPGSTSLSLYVDAHTSAASGTPGGLLASSAEGAHALTELPGESWLAIGLGNLGQTLGRDVAALGELTALASSGGGSGAGATATSTLSLGGLVNGLLAPLSVLAADNARARQEFTSWMGSGGVFASGSGLLDLKGAVVIESRSPASSRAAVGELAALLAHAGDSSQPISIPGTDAAVAVKVNGLPLMLVIANGRDQSGGTKFVLGLGEASVTTALHPPSTLADAPSRSAAANTLGEGLSPSVIFEVPTLLGLLEAVGLTEDPTLSKILPYARAVTTIDGGGHALANEVERYKLVVGLRPAGSG
ncbi:MAG TPA: DUF3352 domain-containing protein [Solirubrobacteraceae bacterium]|nr:DUF3352 domain-containing protein [Solirubrobacteraceae bacterium]